VECLIGELLVCGGDGVKRVGVDGDGFFVLEGVLVESIPKRVVRIGEFGVGVGRGTGVVGGCGGSGGDCSVLVCCGERDWF